MTELATVVCPSCFEGFGVPCPQPDEVPCEVDYDCEICCRPMVVRFWVEPDGAVGAEAVGLGE